jgi:hypothetical protein
VEKESVEAARRKEVPTGFRPLLTKTVAEVLKTKNPGNPGETESVVESMMVEKAEVAVPIA